MWVFRAVLIVILIVIVLGFSAYNAEQRVTVDLLKIKYYNVSMIVVTYWAFIIGFLVTFILSISIYFKQAAEIRELKRLSGSLGAEISALRNRPIEEADDNFLLPGKDDKK